MNKRFSLALVLCSIFTTLFAQNYHDAAAFDAYGHVKWILTDVGMYYFGEDGRLDKSKSTCRLRKISDRTQCIGIYLEDYY